jgi:histidinol phosphatase-like enzyme (inositol monophosphatase family)
MVDFESFVQDLAREAGEAILPFFRTRMNIENKGEKSPFDPVTEADKAAELAMRGLIRKNFPAHGIIGEEFGETNSDADYVWVLDPIDGTKGFMCGLPTWGTLIGLTYKGKPVYGMMHQPFVGESFYGDGVTAHSHSILGTKKLKTRKCTNLSDAVLSTTSPHNFSSLDFEKYKAVETSVKLARYGGDCYAYALLAAGHVDIVIESGLAIYDILPLIPVLEGAGAYIASWQGSSPLQGGQIIAAGDKRVFEEALVLLRQN